MTGFTEEQLAELTAPLKREHIKPIEKAGRKLSYLEGWHIIAEANRIFGFDAWDRQTVDLRCVVEKETKVGQAQRDGWRVGYICKVCIVVRNDVSTTVRDGTGYGSGIDIDLGAAHESAAKEAETDATKRALMTFGNPFGLALYDKGQANVEALAPTPRPANHVPPIFPRALPQAPADLPRPAANLPPEGQQLTLGQIRDAIISAIDNADSEQRIRGILLNHQPDLDQILEVSKTTYNRIIGLARGRAKTVGGVLDDWEFAR